MLFRSPILARIQQFFGTRIDSTIFSYWSGQFFGTRTDSTFCRYWPGFNNFPALTLILPFFRTGPDSFRYSHGFHLLPILARIQQFSGTPIHSTIFPNWFGQFFGTRTDSTFCRYWPGFNNFPVLALILPFFRTGPDSFSVLARIAPFAYTGPDSTIFRHSH